MCGLGAREFGGDGGGGQGFPPFPAESPAGGDDAAKGSAPRRCPGALPLPGIAHGRPGAARRGGAWGGREVLVGEERLGGRGPAGWEQPQL